jgi:hypothetical protein
MANQKKNPYPHNNFSILMDYVEELVLLSANERGLIPISEEDDGYQDLVVDHSEVKNLTVPDNAVSATIMVEADDSSTSKGRVIRYKKNGIDPTDSSGFGLGDNDIYEPAGKVNLDNLRFIGIEDGKSHTLRIQYYKTAQV